MNEIELILTDAFNCSRTDLYLNKSIFKQKEFNRIDKILSKRAKQEPLQYALGYTEFFGLRFKVNKDVLVPRPETEILVEEAVGIANKFFSSLVHKLKILDIGTGSGCIAIALAKFLEHTEITAIDISDKVVNLAKENSRIHNVEDKIKFLQSNLFSHNFFKKRIKFDIIVSNPPYIASNEIGDFDLSITKEPRVALDGGRDGLDFYRRIANESAEFLKEEGILFLELADKQSEEIKEIFSKEWIIEKVIKDYLGVERVGIIKRKTNG